MSMKRLWLNEREYITFNEKLDTLTKELATRRRAIDFYALGMYLPNPDPVLKRLGKDIAVYKELLVDSHVGACEKSRKSGVKSMNWSIDRGKARSRVAKVIEEAFSNLDMEQLIGEILNAPFFGYQVLEVIWGKVGNYVLPTRVIGKPQNWFAFDENNELLLRTKDNYMGAPVADRKFLVVQYEGSYDNPYGTPELSRCFWPVTFKKGGFKFWVIFTEKYGMPFIVGKHPRGTPKDETDKLAAMLEAMVQDAIAVIPDDSSVEIMEPTGKGASADIYERLVNAGDEQVSKAILGQTLTTQAQPTGTQALGTVHFKVRDDIVVSDKKLVESAFKKLIRWICELNFMDSERPIFSLWAEGDVDKVLAERDEILSRTGVQFKKVYYQRAYGLSDDEFEVGAPQPQQPQNFNATERPPGREKDAVDLFTEKLLNEATQDEFVDEIKRLLAEVETLEEFRDRLVERYKDLDATALGELIARALTVANLAGRFEAMNA